MVLSGKNFVIPYKKTPKISIQPPKIRKNFFLFYKYFAIEIAIKIAGNPPEANIYPIMLSLTPLSSAIKGNIGIYMYIAKADTACPAASIIFMKVLCGIFV